MKATHKFQIPPVLLAPISDNEQVDTNLEPQFVRVRSGNISELLFDSRIPYLEFDSNNIRISSSASLGARPQNLFDKISRLAIKNFDMFWQPCNVTPFNQNWKWTLTNISGPTTYGPFSHNLPVGFYDLTFLLTQFTTIMTADANGAGIPGAFNFVISADGKTSTINHSLGVNYHFHFDKTCNLATKGQNLIPLPLNDLPAYFIYLGPARLLYTRYVDIVCQDLCRFTKNPNKSINLRSDSVVLRQSLTEPNANWTYKTDNIHLNWINWDIYTPGTIFTFQMFDENGDRFYYIDNNGVNTTLNWTMSILLEF